MTYKAKEMYVIGRKMLRELILIIIGSLFLAIGTDLFLLPNQLSSGGFTGITTILYYLFKFPMGTSMIIINIPLFVVALFKLGKRFFVKFVPSNIISII